MKIKNRKFFRKKKDYTLLITKYLINNTDIYTKYNKVKYVIDLLNIIKIFI